MKPVLDVCCGPKGFYFDKKDKRVLFCDNRRADVTVGNGAHRQERAVDPDRVCDFTALPFADKSFRMVVFDPPHLVRCSGGYMKVIYGFLPYDW